MTEKSTQQLSPSLEDYLEATFWAAAAHGTARVKDIAKTMQVKASSVTGALQALAQSRHINYTPYEAITLTNKGFDAAMEVVQKHKILKDFFADILGVDNPISEDIACKIEHIIPCSVIERIAKFVTFLETASPEVITWSDKLKRPDLAGKHRKSTKKLRAAECTKKEEFCDLTNYETTVADLKPAEQAVIVQVKPCAVISSQLAHMGLGRGALITVERTAPLGDPITVKIRGYRLILRKKDAANIVVVSK
ncbi:MAG: DtxR family transcriptional regulator [Sedimentisphaerales bacterium]|nr:DtxR family transcriptional regulator [Sedimentisphaerales bacterium]